MNIKKARNLLGKQSSKYSDEEVGETIETMTMLANIIIDKYLEMTPEERKKWHEEHK